MPDISKNKELTKKVFDSLKDCWITFEKLEEDLSDLQYRIMDITNKLPLPPKDKANDDM